jgi:hypothetical protein
MMRIELDSVRRYRGKKEYRPVNRARCMGIEEIGDHQIIVSICRKLLAAGFSGDVEVWRGDVPCFSARNASEWASGKALTGEQPEHLRRKQ